MQAYKDNPPLYIKFPKEVSDAAGLDPAVLYRIRKYLYGLPDSGRAYYIAYSSHLIKGGYKMSAYDPCLFYKFENGQLIIISIHVDDTYLAATTLELIEQFKTHLRTQFTITFKDTVHTYLGVQHTLDSDGRNKLSQTKLLNELFDKMDINSETSLRTPSTAYPRKVSFPDEPADLTEYKSITGIMQFLIKSRPDIAYVVSDASTKNSRATNKDRQALQTIGQYLYNTRSLGLTLPAGADPSSRVIKLTCWVDASFLTHDNSKSHTGCRLRGKLEAIYWLCILRLRKDQFDTASTTLISCFGQRQLLHRG
jgi:hypothetical protein